MVNQSCPHGVVDLWCDRCHCDVDGRGKKIVAFYPDQRQIEEACWAIRQGWSEVEHRQRAGMVTEEPVIQGVLRYLRRHEN